MMSSDLYPYSSDTNTYQQIQVKTLRNINLNELLLNVPSKTISCENKASDSNST